MNKREKIIGLVMVVTILIWIFTSLGGSDKRPKPVVNKQPQAREDTRSARLKRRPQPSGNEVPGPQVDYLAVVEQVQLKSGLKDVLKVKDPFQRMTRKSEAPAEKKFKLQLTGIMMEDDEPLALINDEVLRVGDTLHGYRLESISNNQVTMSRGLERYVLKLHMEFYGE